MDSIHIKDIRQGMKNLNLTVIVLDVGNPVLLKENREVRTLKVADATACINLSLWDEVGHYIIPGDIIRLTKAHANTFRNCLTLYSSKTGEIDKIGDFCMVFNEQHNMSDPNLSFDSVPGPLNNGNINNGNKMMRPSGAPLLLPQLPQKPIPPRFQNEPTNINKPLNKINTKPGRGKSNVVRPERRS